MLGNDRYICALTGSQARSLASILTAEIAAGLMIKLAEPDVPPPGAGVVTVMVDVPMATKSGAGTCAERDVALV